MERYRGIKWGAMTPELRRTHMAIVNHVLRKVEKGKTVEQVSEELMLDPESVKGLLKYYQKN